ncbi:MAG: molybdopterin converting factor subunit 1 [Proteobacteria bacterium]|nr:molybdopterin converting factor subunit 1 [Pseudomonadota bacterium]
MMVDVVYFAWVREGVGKAQESVDPPAEVVTVADLIDWLGHEVLRDKTRLRAAVDQLFVPLDAPIAGAREVAIFPPVTGG